MLTQFTIVFMKIYSNKIQTLILALQLIAAAVFTTGCSAVIDPTLGSDIIAKDQKLVMRHLEFKGGKVITFDPTASTDQKTVYAERPGQFFETTLYKTDSLRSANISYGYIGVERSDTFGMRSARFASSIVYMNSLTEDYGFGYRPIFDTMMLVLSISSYGIDTLTPLKYNIYELEKPLLGNGISEEDSTAYHTFDMSKVYDPKKPLFSFTFPDGKETGPSTRSINLEPVDMSRNGATWNFLRRLMLIPDNYDTPEWDGWAKDKDGIYQDELDFTEKFNGICIIPDMESVEENKLGALYAIKLGASGLFLQCRSRDKNDPTQVVDTVGMNYYFLDETTNHNMSVSNIEHDYTKSMTSAPAVLNSLKVDGYDKSGNKIPRSERTKVSECWIEGCAGVVTELYFTDQMIEELKHLTDYTATEQFTTIGVNKCVMHLYTRNALYDWESIQSNTEAITEILNKSLKRIGTFTNINTLSTIADYDYISEQYSNVTLSYGGELNRSLGRYELDITSFMQSMLHYINELRHEDGTYDEWDEEIQPRTLYLGTEAIYPYELKRSFVQGADDGVNQAPISMEMIYTMIK